MYENDYIGKIVILQNIVFNTGKNKLDHAYKGGRPCLLIYNDEEYDYFLTIKSELRTKSYDFEYYKLNSKDFMYIYNYHKTYYKSNFPYIQGYVNLMDIHKRRASGYGSKDYAKLKLSTYKDIINKFKKLHNSENMEVIMSKASIIK